MVYDDHLQGRFWIMIYDDHLQGRFWIMVYDDHLQGRFWIMVYDDHLQGRFWIMVYDDHLQDRFWSSARPASNNGLHVTRIRIIGKYYLGHHSPKPDSDKLRTRGKHEMVRPSMKTSEGYGYMMMTW
jgi:hypothetical protein